MSPSLHPCILLFYDLFYNSWNLTERKIKAGIRTKARETKVLRHTRKVIHEDWAGDYRNVPVGISHSC